MVFFALVFYRVLICQFLEYFWSFSRGSLIFQRWVYDYFFNSRLSMGCASHFLMISLQTLLVASVITGELRLLRKRSSWFLALCACLVSITTRAFRVSCCGFSISTILPSYRCSFRRWSLPDYNFSDILLRLLYQEVYLQNIKGIILYFNRFFGQPPYKNVWSIVERDLHPSLITFLFSTLTSLNVDSSLSICWEQP